MYIVLYGRNGNYNVGRIEFYAESDALLFAAAWRAKSVAGSHWAHVKVATARSVS